MIFSFEIYETRRPIRPRPLDLHLVEKIDKNRHKNIIHYFYDTFLLLLSGRWRRWHAYNLERVASKLNNLVTVEWSFLSENYTLTYININCANQNIDSQNPQKQINLRAYWYILQINIDVFRFMCIFAQCCRRSAVRSHFTCQLGRDMNLKKVTQDISIVKYPQFIFYGWCFQANCALYIWSIQ